MMGIKRGKMGDEFLERIFKNSEKAKFLEAMQEYLNDYDKLVIVMIKDKENGAYSDVVMTLGLNSTYEAYGILEVGKQDLIEDDIH